MAAGRPPFEGDSAMTVMLKHVNEAVPDIRSRAEVPAALKDILDKVLAKFPAQRYQTAAEFANALRGVAQRPYVREETTQVPGATQPPVGATIIEPQRPTAPAPGPTPMTAAQPRPMATIRENMPAVAPAPRPTTNYTAPMPNAAPAAPAPAYAPPAERRGPSGMVIGGIVVALVLCVAVVLVVAAVLGGPTIMALLGGSTATPGVVAQVTDTPGAQGATDVPVVDTDVPDQPTETEGAVVDTDTPPTDAPAPTDTSEVPPTEGPTDTPEPTQIVVPDGMLLIPAGTFNMGSGSGDAGPVHAVTLGQFMINKFEVSNASYEACVNSGGCTAPAPRSSFTHGSYFGNPDFAQYPVINVNWNQAQQYCQAQGGRLPTEAEWEYAATGGDGRRFPWGNDFDSSLVPVSAGDTSAGGSFPGGASPFGVYDMAGNVLEWVGDWYSQTYYASSPAENPTGPDTGNQKVLRGGSFGNGDPAVYTTTRRFARNPGGSDVDIGFRCVQPVP
jgi:formylglycine-generating enzyme required for sulfatase activity